MNERDVLRVSGASADRLPRKLAAILYADARDYSRMVHHDEVRTVAAVRDHFQHLIGPRIAHHGGRMVKTMGDGLMADFASVVDAVRCGLDVQHAMRGRNSDIAEEHRIEFRIGVNLGDVIVQDEDLLGDGVNIAARLQAIADPGSICISRAVYDQVRHKIEAGYEYVGRRRLKNIPDAIEVFRIRPGVSAGAGRLARLTNSRPRRIPDQPDRPSIVILPLANTAGSPHLEIFCDGLTDGVITNLSKFRDLFVIARQSSFAYKNKPVSPAQVVEELGVRYILDGSVLAVGDKLRLSLRLSDTTTGYNLWGAEYDRRLEDLFQVQDEITRTIVGTLSVRLEEAEKGRLRTTDPSDWRAYAYLLKGKEHFLENTRAAHAKAQTFFRKAIAADPGCAQAYGWLSRLYNHRCRYGWTGDPTKALAKSLAFANKAIQLDPADAKGYCELGIVNLYMRNVQLAIVHLERAHRLNPNDADIISELADAYVYDRRPKDALDLLNLAFRLNPFPPDDYYWVMADAYYGLRDYEAVIRTGQRMLNPSECDRLVAASYAQLGRLEQARAHAAEVMRKHPNFRVSVWMGNQPDRDDAEAEHFCDGLRKAGLPE
ncbi:MAG TPA: adenylate/guanylate cyclase domain-containing protein [Alphaproteobacteria bacterium]|nr:adenylate/guanylate cyclase domain-containing protein [Alphaproteobacteria bacterium]